MKRISRFAIFLIFCGFISEDFYAQPVLSIKPAWLEDGIIQAGNYEPLIFRRRRGYYLREDYFERFQNEHTEETVKKLKEMGVNFVMIHGYKGFGIEAEKETRRYAKQLLPLHGQGR